VVRANVQINPQETQMTKEQFDPDNKVVRSQRQSMDDSGGKTGGTPGVQANIPGGEAAKVTQENASKRSSEIVTYEVGHTTSRISEPRGQVQKLSVAVLVDGKYEKDKYVARTKEEMEVIKGMVKRAVGFDEDRGDEIEVANVAFKIQPAPALQAPGAPELKDMITSPIGIGVGVGVFLALGALGFFFMRRKPAQKEIPGAAPVESVVIAPAIEEVQEEPAVAARKIVLSEDPRKEQLAQIARDYHDATVRIIRTWLQEDINRVRAATSSGTNGAEMPQ
jgi:flagellar M-ring protein FliF